MTDSTNPRVMADNIRELDARSLTAFDQLDDISDQVEALQTYSSNEIETGELFGTEKVYRKVITIDTISEGDATVAHGITNLGIVLRIDGSVQGGPDGANRYDLNYYSGTNYRTITWIDGANIRFSIGTVLAPTFVKAIVILTYTKVTTP